MSTERPMAGSQLEKHAAERLELNQRRYAMRYCDGECKRVYNTASAEGIIFWPHEDPVEPHDGQD